MKLGEGESVTKEFFFRTSGDRGHMATVTDRRLVISYKNAEESYPLSKIQGIRIVFDRSIGMIIVGALLALFGLAALGDNATVGLVLLGIGGFLVYRGWTGKTQLLISQPGGDKAYGASGNSDQLKDFVETVNGKLS